MWDRVRRRSSEENGFTLVELLLVTLIIGILAAIAIPSFVTQKGNASDASAKSLAREAQTAAEAYAVDYEGTYEAMTAAALHAYERAIQIAPGGGNAYLSSVTVEPGERGYVVTATATDGHTFSVERKANGTVLRTCTPAGKVGAAGGGCQNSTW